MSCKLLSSSQRTGFKPPWIIRQTDRQGSFISRHHSVLPLFPVTVVNGQDAKFLERCQGSFHFYNGTSLSTAEKNHTRSVLLPESRGCKWSVVLFPDCLERFLVTFVDRYLEFLDNWYRILLVDIKSDISWYTAENYNKKHIVRVKLFHGSLKGDFAEIHSVSAQIGLPTFLHLAF